MAEEQVIEKQSETTVEVVKTVDVAEPAKQSKWYRWSKDGTALVQSKWYLWRKDGKALVAYLLDSEVHTFAFSVAANVILSFIPFIVLLYLLADTVLHRADTVFHRSEMMQHVINDMVAYFLPSNQGFIAQHLADVAAASSKHGVQVFSVVMILVACTGIFLPLEVALNQAWGVTKSRNYLHNQAIAFGLATLMVVLGIGSILMNALARWVLSLVLIHTTHIRFIDFVLNITYQGTSFILLAATTGFASILFFFSIYWLLPNRKVPWRPVLRTSIYTGVIWLVSKYLFEALLPHMHLQDLYGPFCVSVSILFWAYTSGLILFAGAQFSVARMGNGKSEVTPKHEQVQG
ncbi:MAG: YihY/virulence factor BrkB family protein [Terracidiphilus sp.]